ncbi:MAG TPA: V-type ATP synthase subunit D [Bacteroidales bacterium]|nr:V-type ATP synthase subunit D [Bacteroidales bacterium]HPF02350.1 V-type ATP synthase subunit D [Bacteroidales bacterium]HPJ58195.1 V-type ATP synthase subunit D [Bacteroidales bacterium]HPR11526.1 V-type ATP synthase subunit D [Bacteroidales bacterium]HRW84268.1 V-type ATP synthase subunit D [Bacteroidales bacterium]
MAIRFQYNKISLQALNKQLRIRTQALPILKNKESALRIEVKKAKDVAENHTRELLAIQQRYDDGVRLWTEFNPAILQIKDISIKYIKIAGIKIPEFDNISFTVSDFSLFDNPNWFPDGIRILKDLYTVLVKKDLALKKVEMLNFARKKTTQKVNLYEKVQIPGYEEAIRRIKSFLEDEENLLKSAQKIIKSRQEMTEAAAEL